MNEARNASIAKAWMAAMKHNVMGSHFVCADEDHLAELVNEGRAIVIHGAAIKLSTMKPIWVATRFENFEN